MFVCQISVDWPCTKWYKLPLKKTKKGMEMEDLPEPLGNGHALGCLGIEYFV